METSVKWRNEYRQYRSSRCRLYFCMISFMVFIALSAICATFLFRNSFYFHPKDYELNSGEMRAVTASTLFCESIVVKGTSFKRQIIVISSPLERSEDRNKLVFTDVVLLRRDRAWYRSFYLLAGSSVSVRVASRHSVNVYWLKGRRILDKWSDEMNKDLKEPSKKNSDKFTGTRMAEAFTVNEDNNYYLGITSIAGNTKYSEIFVNMSIHRMTYHVSSYRASCNASVGETCQVTLRFNSADTALISIPDNVTALRTRDVWVTWYCAPRIWFYAAVFGGSFVLVVLVLSFAYCCFMSKVKKKIHKWKPHVVAVRRENWNKENNGGVILTSINLLAGTSDENCENRIELTPLRLTPAGNTRHDNTKPDIPNHSTPNGLNNNNPSGSTGLTSFTGANYVDSASEPPEISALWRPPSPRWSTFLSDDDYEECVTNFRESPMGTLDSMKKASEDEDFECELNDRLQSLQYNGPVETDIDNVDSEISPFLNDDSGEYSESEVILRQKDKRKEQRWEPRLSVVTEI